MSPRLSIYHEHTIWQGCRMAQPHGSLCGRRLTMWQGDHRARPQAPDFARGGAAPYLAGVAHYLAAGQLPGGAGRLTIWQGGSTIWQGKGCRAQAGRLPFWQARARLTIWRLNRSGGRVGPPPALRWRNQGQR